MLPRLRVGCSRGFIVDYILVTVEQASAAMQDVTDVALQLRYRTTAARILDAHRKFLDASVRFYELSLAQVCLLMLVVRPQGMIWSRGVHDCAIMVQFFVQFGSVSVRLVRYGSSLILGCRASACCEVPSAYHFCPCRRSDLSFHRHYM